MGIGDIPAKQVPVGDIFIPDSITGNKINTIKHIKYHIYILFILYNLAFARIAFQASALKDLIIEQVRINLKIEF